MAKAKYIVVEGPIGVGKTSLAKILADEFQSRRLFERVEDNPFPAQVLSVAGKPTRSKTRRFFCSAAISSRWSWRSKICLARDGRGLPVRQDQIFASLTLSAEELQSLPANLCSFEYPRAQAGFSGLSAGPP